MRIHNAYNDIKDSIKTYNAKHPSPEAEEQRQEAYREELERRNGWKGTPILERERLGLELLGDERLTISDLLDRLVHARPDCDIYRPYAVTLVKRLYDAGEIERVGEEYRSRIRYRYFRKSLSGPIMDLDRAFNDPTDTEET